MTAHFELAHNNWRSGDARVFADELRQAHPLVRDRISRQFGLTLAFDPEGLRVDYDGRKIGFGGFSSKQGKTTFSIAPKVDDFDVRALFNCIDALNLYNKIVQFENNQEADVHEEEENPFSWAFLLGLLEDINDFGVHHFLIFNSKKILSGRSSVIGRPVAKSLVMNMARGRFGIDCEVLDNHRQRQYASLFFATAQSIFRDLMNWQAVIKRSDARVSATYNSIAAKLKHFADVPFSSRLVLELSHPPYTYGVKTLLMKCLRYWRWKGMFAATNSRSTNTFWSVSIALDTAFELYAGQILKKMLGKKGKIPKVSYPYSFDFNDHRFPDDRIQREIEPDHIYFDQEAGDLVIAEVKYSNHLAVREHVAQLIAYLSYGAYPFVTKTRTGLLVYPGTQLSCEKIPNFRANIYLLTLPANENFVMAAPLLDLGLAQALS
jgi:hypothetical protein